jgi:hypothetical protein
LVLWAAPQKKVSSFVVVEGVYIYSKGAREPQSITPEGRGSPPRLIIDSIRIAVEAA